MVSGWPTAIEKGSQMEWSLQAEFAIRGLIQRLRAYDSHEIRKRCERLPAVFAGQDLWSSYFLKPNGDVVCVGEDLDRPDAERVTADGTIRLRVFVWLSRRHPELATLLPQREPNSIDCDCEAVPLLTIGQLTCGTCNGLGWLPT